MNLVFDRLANEGTIICVAPALLEPAQGRCHTEGTSGARARPLVVLRDPCRLERTGPIVRRLVFDTRYPIDIGNGDADCTNRKNESSPVGLRRCPVVIHRWERLATDR